MQVTGNTDFLPIRKRRLTRAKMQVIAWKEAELPIKEVNKGQTGRGKEADKVYIGDM